MNKCNKAEIMKLCNEINKKSGEGTLYTIDSKHANLKIDRWSTGIADLDEIIGGGVPEGRVIEIFGAEGAGKTSLVYHLCSLHPLCLDIPIEGCVDCDTEFFNGREWKRIADYKEGEKVLQYNPDGTAELVLPEKFYVGEAEYLWQVYSQRMEMCVSDGHRVVYKTTSKNPKLMVKPFYEIREAYERNKDGFCGNVPKTFEYNGKGIDLSENVIRLMVAIFADGSFRNNTTQCYVGLSKKRKRNRIEWLLNKCEISYRKKNNFYIFYAPFNCKHYPKEWYDMSQEQLRIVLDEMKHWDGCQFEIGHVPSFVSNSKEDADFIQFAYTSIGYAAYITIRNRIGNKNFYKDHWVKTKNLSYVVCGGLKSKSASLRKIWIEPYKTKDGKKYCFTMPSTMWVMRKNNKIIVTGNTFDINRAKMFGNKPKQMLIYRARYGEDAFNKITKFAKAGMPLICVDSVPSMIPKDDVEKVLKSAEKDSIEQQKLGGVAGLFTKYLPPIEEIIENTGTTILFVNQIRDKIGALPFGEQTHTMGGHKLSHADSLKIRVARKGWIEIPNKNPKNSALTEKVGFIMKCKVEKSKVCNPLGECEIPCFFDRGFVSYDDVQTIRKELMEQRAEMYSKKKSKEIDDEEAEETWEDEDE